MTAMSFVTNQLEIANRQIELQQFEANQGGIPGQIKPGSKTAKLFELLRRGPQSTQALMDRTGLTSKQVYGLLKYHMTKGTVVRKHDEFHLLDTVEIEINRCIAFLESHGYEFD